jgi:nucleoid-associated protein YgaU
MKSVTGNWKAFLVLLGVLVAAGCQTKAPEEEAPAADTQAAAAETQPAAEEEAAPAVEAAAMAGETYDVVKGDHLWGIAAKSRIYGNPYQWPLIYKANADSIEDADLIQPGQVLNIARDSSADEIDAAVRHAKTRGAWSLGVTEESDKAYLAQ